MNLELQLHRIEQKLKSIKEDFEMIKKEIENNNKNKIDNDSYIQEKTGGENEEIES